MELIDMAPVTEKMKAELRNRHGMRNPNLEDTQYLKGLLDAINEKCAAGFRFTGITYSNGSDDGFFLMFLKSETPFKYVIKTDNEFVNAEDFNQFKRGFDKLGEVHAVFFLVGIIDGAQYICVEDPNAEKEVTVVKEMHKAKLPPSATKTRHVAPTEEEMAKKDGKEPTIAELAARRRVGK